MTNQKEINDIAKEVVEVLEYFDEDFLSKIPEEVRKSFQKLSENSTINIEIDKNKSLSEQNISKETKDFIAILYYEYVADEDEKKEMVKVWNENEELYQESLKQNIVVNSIFHDDLSDTQKDILQEEKKEMVVYQTQNVFQKIVSFLKNIFKR
ncbi:MAG: hypothetical protein IJ629_06845 [Clostridia bacterium]|nr:hypothetical protein [Clostridia bacterium]